MFESRASWASTTLNSVWHAVRNARHARCSSAVSQRVSSMLMNIVYQEIVEHLTKLPRAWYYLSTQAHYYQEHLMTESTTTTAIPGYVAGTWTIDPVHSEIGFSARHMMVSKVRGKFGNFSGQIVTAE